MKNREIRTSNIPWCTHTWNPGVGCLRGCKYCYARGIMKRFTAKHYAKAEVECFKKYNDISASLQEKMYEAIFQRLQKFEPTFLYSQTYERKWFPLQPAVIFIDALSDIDYWRFDMKCLKIDEDGENVFFDSFDTEDTEGIIYVFDRLKEKMNKDHVFVVLTKEYTAYNSLQIELPKNLIPGFTMDSRMWENMHQPNNWVSLGTETRRIHSKTQNRVVWSLEPMTVQEFSKFTWIIDERITRDMLNRDSFPDWVIYGPKTPNRKLTTRDEKEMLMNALYFWKKLNIPVMLKGLKYGPGETPIQPLVNAPVDIMNILKKWKKEKYSNY